MTYKAPSTLLGALRLFPSPYIDWLTQFPEKPLTCLRQPLFRGCYRLWPTMRKKNVQLCHVCHSVRECKWFSGNRVCFYGVSFLILSATRRFPSQPCNPWICDASFTLRATATPSFCAVLSLILLSYPSSKIHRHQLLLLQVPSLSFTH